ncbi:hypothetical protein H6P81_018126 [Aristolochia fimbriata]|uniref:NOT2/NOT3/NOT5 C-terminal domain-containing protein n=1 Tax=Aristolochia fimbriata TaxID=158543 RepID=A0AAV7E4E5_ARIFI|nr:hypothetical protein H6P81_018126 [Aristolochia fimbriata]
MSGLLNSTLNGSTSNLLDSSGRPFGTSFSAQSATAPVFHHSGTLQGLHNIHGSFTVPNLPASLSSRNSAMAGMPSTAVQQPAGNLSGGRFASNNIPVALSQISHGSSHGHSGVANRGLGVSPILGNAGPRMTSSVGSIVGGGSNVGRTLNSGGGFSMPGLTSRVNISANNGSGNLTVQGPGRLMSGVLQQAPQVLSVLGNSYSSSGPLSQSQVQAANNPLSSMGMLNDVNTNDSSPFDINDFPQLTGRPSSAGGPQGQLGSLRKQGVGVSSIVQQSQEFSIQNEDFPALPGFKGGNNEFSMDMHQKDQHIHDNSVPMMQSQHFPMARSIGFSLGGTYSSHRQQQQQQQQQQTPVGGTGNGSFSPVSNQDHLHLHGSDLFPSSHGAYHSQTGGPNIGLRPLNSSSSVSGIGSYDQLIQQYQHHQNQPQFRLQQQMSAAASQSYRDQSLKSLQGTTTQAVSPDRFGLLGLLGVIKLSDPDLSSLALGIDLTTLGLNLNSTDNLHKTFGSPWSDGPAKGEPEYVVPECYYTKQAPSLHQGYFSKFLLETLFYIFYSMPKDEAQLYAANELYARGWFYHRELRLWFTRVANTEPLVKTNSYERGSYHCFDPNTWDTILKDNFVVHYEHVEKRPAVP